MILQKRQVNLNAYITDLTYLIDDKEGKKTLSIKFQNLNYGTINAIKMSLVAKDSFGDKIDFKGLDRLEIKRADLNIKPCKKASFSVDVGDYDIRQVELEVKQIVFDNLGIVTPKEPEIVEYEIEELQASLPEDGKVLSVMHEVNRQSMCFPQHHEKGWICACGNLNANTSDKCCFCDYERNSMFESLSKENVNSIIEEREERKKKILAEAEEKRKREEEEAEQKRKKDEEEAEQRRKIEFAKAEKKQKIMKCSVIGAIVLTIVIIISASVIHEIKYGLSDEEKKQYDVAQENYDRINSFVSSLTLDFYELAETYYDSNFDYNHDRENRLSEAEQDSKYLYTRGIYEASSLLYELIEEQYPEKYHVIYRQLVELHKSDIFNDVALDENMCVKNGDASANFVIRNDMADTMEITEAYLNTETLNPRKIKNVAVDMSGVDYSKVYGISLGILYYDDGLIKYIGEFSEEKANGYGKSWYSTEDGGGSFCEGEFENGCFVSGNHYGTDGNTNDINDAKKVVFDGDFDAVQGLTNSISSESVADKAKNDEANNVRKAQNECGSYVNLVLDKQSSIDNITWFRTPRVSGDYYYFSCKVEENNATQEATITVKKQSDGTFKAQGLEFDD